MAKRKKRSLWRFILGMEIYALLFLGAAAWGLHSLWGYMEAYERSRPHIALDAYMETLTAEYVCDASWELIAKIDHTLQSEENCRQVIRDSLSGGITCAKKSAECTPDKQVYVLRSGGKVIGTMEMERQGEAVHGFIPWAVTGDSFDLSFLLTDPVSVTVPSEYPVYAGGNPLTEAHITQSGIPYDLLGEFYGDYALPTMTTYTAGPFLGEVRLSVTDPEGTAVFIDETTDVNTFLDNCTSEEQAQLDTVITGFIRSYVDFTTCAGNDSEANYRRLVPYMIPGGELAKRMHAALDGLQWVSDRGAELSALTVSQCVNIGGGRYLCDVTYTVDTRDYTGQVQTTSRVKLIFLQTEDGLKAETMLSC